MTSAFKSLAPAVDWPLKCFVRFREVDRGAPVTGDVIGGLVAEHVVSRSVRDTVVALDAV